MSKKNFIALAQFIKDRPSIFTNEAIIELANFCQSQNNNFNRSCWLSFIKGECGSNGGKVK